MRKFAAFTSKNLGLKRQERVILTKNWSVNMLKTICHRVSEMGSAMTRRAGSGKLI